MIWWVINSEEWLHLDFSHPRQRRSLLKKVSKRKIKVFGNSEKIWLRDLNPRNVYDSYIWLIWVISSIMPEDRTIGHFTGRKINWISSVVTFTKFLIFFDLKFWNFQKFSEISEFFSKFMSFIKLKMMSKHEKIPRRKRKSFYTNSYS